MIGLTAAVYSCFQLSLWLAGLLYEGIGILVYLFAENYCLCFLFNVYTRLVFLSRFYVFNVFLFFWGTFFHLWADHSKSQIDVPNVNRPPIKATRLPAAVVYVPSKLIRKPIAFVDLSRSETTFPALSLKFHRVQLLRGRSVLFEDGMKILYCLNSNATRGSSSHINFRPKSKGSVGMIAGTGSLVYVSSVSLYLVVIASKSLPLCPPLSKIFYIGGIIVIAQIHRQRRRETPPVALTLKFWCEIRHASALIL